MNGKCKRICALALTVCLILALGGCAAQAPKSDLREISVVLDWYPNALHAFMYVAMEKGYYAQEGLKVNIRFPSNANDAISLVAAGQAEIGLYYQQDAIQARINQNVPVKTIAAVVQRPLNIVLSLAEKDIHSPQDLVGKTIGYASTELSEAIVRSIMGYVGADSSDVTLVDVGFDLMSAMTTGQVDATIGCLVNHEVPQLQEEGFDVTWFELDDYGVPSYYEGVFLANDDTIAKDSAMLSAFLRASAKGFADMKADPEEALKILLANQNEENFPLSETVERKSMETLLPLMETETNPFLTQSDDCWLNNIVWMQMEGLIDAKLSENELDMAETLLALADEGAITLDFTRPDAELASEFLNAGQAELSNVSEDDLYELIKKLKALLDDVRVNLAY